MSLSKDRLIFDPADLVESDNIGAYVRAGSDGDLVSSTNVGGKEGLDVNVINASIEVTATDLDIRDLEFATDSVDVSGSAVTAVVSATDLDIRDLSAAQDNVAISDGTDTLAVNADGSINSVVSATDLDIRDLVFATDKVDVSGSTISIDSDHAEDSAHVSGDIGSFMLAVRNDVEGSLVGTDGDYAPLQVDALGRLRVLADMSVTNSAEKAEDSAHSSGDIGSYSLGVIQAVPASSAADGDYGSIKTDALGRMWSNTGPNVSQAQGLVTVGVLEGALPASALANRRKIIIQNTSSNDVFVGPTGVLTTTGLRVGKGATLEMEAGPNIALFAIAAGAGNVVRVWELA